MAGGDFFGLRVYLLFQLIFLGASASASEILLSDEVPSPLPQVSLAPKGMDLPCENEILDFNFVPDQQTANSDTAFWMMWMAMRSFTSDQSTTDQEIRNTGFVKYQAFHDSVTGLQGFLAGNSKGMVLTFRGSTEITDWVVDAALPLIDGDVLGLPGRVHAGFAYALRSQWTQIEAAINRFGGYNKPLFISGHSLGGALATLAAYKLANEGYQVQGLYTYAAPRSGDREYADWGAGLLEGRHFRFINDRDLVPRYPPRAESIPWFEKMLSVGLASRLWEWLALQLPYAHRGELVVFDHNLEAQPLADSDIHDDQHMWSSIAQFVRWKGLANYLVEIALNQKHLHNEKSYLCLLKKYRDSSLNF